MSTCRDGCIIDEVVVCGRTHTASQAVITNIAEHYVTMLYSLRNNRYITYI